MQAAARQYPDKCNILKGYPEILESLKEHPQILQSLKKIWEIWKSLTGSGSFGSPKRDDLGTGA